MDMLRGPGGCPWDREQTPESLKKYIIEEAYEVLEAIDAGEAGELTEELGDLLLQVVFQAQLGREEGLFNIDDVLEKITGKLKRRHPHVFGDVEVSGAAEVLQNWEAIKRDEKEERRSLFDGVPVTQPSLRRASRVQQRAATVGFDWPDLEPVMEKFMEEVGELQEALSSGDGDRIFHELGDVLFSAVNLGRHIGVEAEDALRETIRKFQTRFGRIEKSLEDAGRTLDEATLEEMDELWNLAKEEEREN
jgi:tetrapyrrole methylase family protein/MazG family protein